MATHYIFITWGWCLGPATLSCKAFDPVTCFRRTFNTANVILQCHLPLTKHCIAGVVLFESLHMDGGFCGSAELNPKFLINNMSFIKTWCPLRKLLIDLKLLGPWGLVDYYGWPTHFQCSCNDNSFVFVNVATFRTILKMQTDELKQTCFISCLHDIDIVFATLVKPFRYLAHINFTIPGWCFFCWFEAM